MNVDSTTPVRDATAATATVAGLVGRSRAAQAVFSTNPDQARYDRAAAAAAWAIMEPGRNRALAELAVRSTGLGNVADKIVKNHRKTLGLMRDIKGQITCGIIEDNRQTGITQIARPAGVVGAVVPSTNPAATPANNIINALKCGNSIILSPSPKGSSCCELLLSFVHKEFDRIHEDHDLVQMIPPPGSKAATQTLLELCDLAIATGSADNVRRACTSGTPALAVGVGNATVIVDETADIATAAQKIALSKTFDNATSCSSENALVVVDAVHDAFVAALTGAGAAVIADDAAIVACMWPRGKLNPGVVARDASVMIEALGLTGQVPKSTRFIAVETKGVGADHPLSGEKLSLVLALYRARDFDDAVAITYRLQQHQGAGHSVGLHSSVDARALTLANAVPTCRVIVNQAHCFATGGAFDNGMPFSLSMGCGTWGGNSFDTNLHWKHFMQTTRIVRQVAPREPTLDEVFGEYWQLIGRAGKDAD